MSCQPFRQRIADALPAALPALLLATLLAAPPAVLAQTADAGGTAAAPPPVAAAEVAAPSDAEADADAGAEADSEAAAGADAAAAAPAGAAAETAAGEPAGKTLAAADDDGGKGDDGDNGDRGEDSRAPEAALDVIRRLQKALEKSVARSDAEDCTDRADRLTPLISETFDIPAIARQVLRRHWQGLSESQQADFAGRLRTLTIAGFAANFGGSTPIRFTEPALQREQGSRIVVRTELQREGKDPVVFDFLMHRFEGRWRVINVVAQGVSELSLRSSQYDAVMRSDGFDVLLQKIDAQISEIRKSC